MDRLRCCCAQSSNGHSIHATMEIRDRQRTLLEPNGIELPSVELEGLEGSSLNTTPRDSHVANKLPEHDDVELRSLESKLELLKVQRQISAAKCEAFLAELESHQASISRRHRRSLDSQHSTNARQGSSRSTPGVSRSHSSNVRRAPSSRVHRSEGAIPLQPELDVWDEEAASYFGRSRSCRR